MLQMILCYEWRMKKLANNSTLKKTKIMAFGPITSCQIEGEKVEERTDFIFLGTKITAGSDCSHEIKKTLARWKKKYDKPRQHIKKQRHHFATKVHIVKAMFLFSSYVWM